MIDAVKSVGCRWSPTGKETNNISRVWWTSDPKIIALLEQCADMDNPRDVHQQLAATRKASVEASYQADTDFQPPVPQGIHPMTGKPFQLMPFQRAGVEFCIQRNSALIGDAPGLGKTLQAIGVANCMPDFKRGLFVCPATLKSNWYREIKLWLVHPNKSVGIAQGSYWPDTDIVIVNYDILLRHRESVEEVEWDLVVLDEAHYIKSAKAQRTYAILGNKKMGLKPIRAKRKLALTGTPILNRPGELFSILHWLDPNAWPSRFYFAQRYCAGGYGLYDGASNLEELQLRLRSTCFRYETMVECDVGVLPIGRIVEEKLNVRVKSYNHVSSKVEWRQVLAHSKRPAPRRLVRVVHESGEFCCTADHKIWTEAGYNRADSLVAGVCLRVLRRIEANDRQGKGLERSLLHNQVCGNETREVGYLAPQGKCEETIETKSSERKTLQEMSGFNSSVESSRLRMGSDKLLQSPLPESQRPQEAASCSLSDSRGAPRGSIQGPERALGQSNQEARESFGVGSYNKVRENSSRSPGLSGGVVGGGGSVYSSDRFIPERRSELVVGGYCSSSESDGNRSGWTAPFLVEEAEEYRRLEREETGISRVESVEILESRSGKSSGTGGREDSFVYDIEVEHNHNFFPAGVLAHNCMIRRLKENVLKELPPKLRSVVEYDDPDLRLEVEEEVRSMRAREAALASLRAAVELAKASDNPQEYKAAVEALRTGLSVAFAEIAELRARTAVAKIPHVIAHIKDIIENTKDKVVVFAHHREVVERICSAFPWLSVKLYGGMSEASKDGSVTAFQTDPNVRIFVGSILAAGVGLTLTAAHRLVFAELDWTPSNVTQAEDRCILEGQPVLTPSGWRPIESIAKGDLVIGLDGQAHRVLDAWNRGCWKPVTEIRVEGWNGWLKTTHDHPYLIYGRWKQAGELTIGDKITPPRIYSSVEMPSLRFSIDTKAYAENGRKKRAPAEIALTQEALFVIGYFVGDGFASTAAGKGRFVSFSGHQEKDATAFRRISAWFEQYGLSGSNRKKETDRGMEMRFYSAEWAQWFAREFGKYAEGKELPEWVWGLSIQQQHWLLDGLAASDGYNRAGKGRIDYVTASDKLASQVYRLAVNCGYAVCKSLSSEKSGRHNVITWCKNGTAGTILEIRHRYSKKTRGKRERVYDLTVEDCASFVVGPAVVHNCHRVGQREQVLVQHIVLSGSLDATIARKLVAKQLVIDRALDEVERLEHDTVIPTTEPELEEVARVEDIDRDAHTFSAEDRQRIYGYLRSINVDNVASPVEVIVVTRLREIPLEAMNNRQVALAYRICVRNFPQFSLTSSLPADTIQP